MLSYEHGAVLAASANKLEHEAVHPSPANDMLEHLLVKCGKPLACLLPEITSPSPITALDRIIAIESTPWVSRQCPGDKLVEVFL